MTGLPVFKPEGLLELSEKLKAPEIRELINARRTAAVGALDLTDWKKPLAKKQ